MILVKYAENRVSHTANWIFLGGKEQTLTFSESVLFATALEFAFSFQQRKGLPLIFLCKQGIEQIDGGHSPDIPGIDKVP